jgi:flagellar motility protein MotE (MotC chaperone)
MDFQTLDTLRKRHPAWRLLMADSAPFVASFLHRHFVEQNLRTIARQELIAKLDDYLFHLRERLGDGVFPRGASEYLDEWSSEDRGWLRKYYPQDSDEPHFDLTPATEKALNWLAGLRQRQFVGTESRLITVFQLLRQIVEGTTADPTARIAELEKRQAEIAAELVRIREGHVDLMDAAQVRDRFAQMSDTAYALLADFRELEQSFRELDRAVREKIATWDGSKGALLDEIFGERDAISDSDQGRSFRAFWDFLMAPARQEELTALLESVYALPPVRQLEPAARLLRIHYDWLEAGEVAQRTVARLSEQLRRYLDEKVWLENRQIMQTIRKIEQSALTVRQAMPAGAFIDLDEPAPSIELPMERPLFSPPWKPAIADQILIEGSGDVPTDVLYQQIYVDKTELAAHIRRALQTRPQISLAELLESRPIERGLAEVVAYLSLAAEDSADRRAIIDDEQKQTIAWTDKSGCQRQATVPLVVYCR